MQPVFSPVEPAITHNSLFAVKNKSRKRIVIRYIFTLMKQDGQYRQLLDGFSSHRCPQVKAFNIIRNVPCFSQLYRIPCAIVYAAKDAVAGEDLKPQSLQVREEYRQGDCLIRCDLKRGIWIGKRNLAYIPFGISAVAGYDLMHWAVMINHTIYQVAGADSEGYCIYTITQYKVQGQNYEWFVTDLQPQLSKKKLRKTIDQFKAAIKQYSMAAVFNSETENCQTFAINLIALACKQNPEDFLSRIMLKQDDNGKDYEEIEVLE